MKMHYGIITLALLAVGVFGTACVGVRLYRVETYDQVSKMPPFEAMILDIDMRHEPKYGDSVDIYMKKANGKQIALEYPSANGYVVNFARYLIVGHSYSFPKVYSDYLDTYGTNRPPSYVLEPTTTTR